MAITSFTATPRGDTTYLLQAASSINGATFYWFKDGEFLGSTPTGAYLATIAVGETPSFEVFDLLVGTPVTGYPSRATMVWTETPNVADYFIVERYADSEWTLEGRIQTNPAGYYQFQSSVLDDVTSHQFRITPYKYDTAGAVRLVTIYVVRHPPPPDSFTASFDGGTNTLSGTITE